ncbi:MAG: lysostaphin resistance A-like protein [Promethearchaeota archaeon]
MQPEIQSYSLELTPRLRLWQVLLIFILNVVLYQISGILLFREFGDVLSSTTLAFAIVGLSILIHLGFFWLFGIKTRKISWTEVGAKNIDFGGMGNIFWAILITVVVFVVRMILNVFLNELFTQEPNEDMVDIITGGGIFLIGFLLSAFVIPIIEEFFFRGLIYRGLRQHLSPRIAIIISSLLFGIAHLNWIQGILAGIMALFLAWMYEKSGSIYIPILMHILNNAISFLIAWYFLV